MLVLLHFFRLGYSPFTLAFLFLLYEAAGIGANLVGGWLATHFGIARMLAVGLATQILGFLLLSAISPGWGEVLSVVWVVVAQGVCGVAKDITKTVSKSAIKLTAGGASGRLFKWVAFFTGSKNAMKGVGFFLGGLLLEALGFRARALGHGSGADGRSGRRPGALPPMMDGRRRRVRRANFREVRRRQPPCRRAVFLFGARDVWFVVGLPVFLYASGWTFTMVGGFLALWTIGYGIIQASAPAVIRRSMDGLSSEVPAARPGRWR